MTELKTAATSSAQAQAPQAWRIVVLLGVANLLNFYDRTLPAILIEPIKAEFGLSDTEIGILGGAFTLVYAVAGIVLGRLSDRMARRKIMAVGLLAWSIMTAASGGAWSFASILIIRMGVGIGEAAYAPAANSVIADLFPPSRRSRAFAIFQIGLPVGVTLAFFTTGAIAEAFNSWRAPFLIAAIPGVVIALALLRIREPQRGASDLSVASASASRPVRPIRTILRIPTMIWLVVAGIGLQVAAYSVSTFLVPLFQRYYNLSLTDAALCAGIVLGLSGLVGLLASGAVADRASRRSPRARVMAGGISLIMAAVLSAWAFTVGTGQVTAFVAIFAAAWLLQFGFHTSAYPAVADVVSPQMRSTAIGVFFAAFYLLGGAFGPVLTGALSEYFAGQAAATATVTAAAQGLHNSLFAVVPGALVIAAVGMFGASTTVNRDHDRMQAANPPDSRLPQPEPHQ